MKPNLSLLFDDIAAPPAKPDQQIPNHFPPVGGGIALIGDAPFNERAVVPFANSHYASLAAMLRNAGIDIRTCFLGNICSSYPPKGKIGNHVASLVDESFERLKRDLDRFRPRCIITLGRDTLGFFKQGAAVDAERGAPFLWGGVPVVPTYHPKEIFVQYKFNILTIADFTKARIIAEKGWNIPEYKVRVAESLQEIVSFLNAVIEKRASLVFDIETNAAMQLTCIGFATSPEYAFVIPLIEAGKRVWAQEQEVILWRLLAKALETCQLTGHNAVHFEHTVLAQHGILANIVGDTMVAHWECYPELKKSLGFCSSLYTLNPYWKDELKLARQGKIAPKNEFIYNGRDNIITYQCAEEIKKEFDDRPPAVKDHYRFNIRLSRAFQYMTLHGVMLDKDKHGARTLQVEHECEQLEQKFFDESKTKINVRSPKQMKAWLYESLKLPVQYKSKKQEDGSYEDVESQDYLSLLYLARQFPAIAALKCAAELRKAQRRRSALTKFTCDDKGRLYWTFNCVGTVSGRASGYEPLSGPGLQPQNVDKRDRDLILPWPGYSWLKADLEGADSWTVAARCKSLGDPTMFNDLLAGIKPAQALAIASIFGTPLIGEPVEELLKYKKVFKEVVEKEKAERGPGKTTYDVMKAVSHGSNYGLKKHTMHDNIFKQSKGELWISADECERFQKMYFKRYPGVPKWHDYSRTQLASLGYLDSCSGTRRFFFGRRDNTTLREWLAHEPQANTGYATNVVIDRLFMSPENRRGRGLFIRLLNQVHDETDLMFPTDELEKARQIFWPMTELELKSAGVTFRIPFEANYGPSWGECKETF